MGWFRNRARWIGHVALLALMLQFGLAFAHVHADDFAPAVSSSSLTASVQTDKTDGTPAIPDRDHCAICATIHLAGALMAPAVAELPAFTFSAVSWTPSFDIAAELPASASFNARAPPQS